jgi:hypothetical protein
MGDGTVGLRCDVESCIDVPAYMIAGVHVSFFSSGFDCSWHKIY